MSEYTPTVEELRAGQEAYRASVGPMSLAIWLAAHDAEKRAEWEAEHKVTYRVIREPENPYLAEVHVVDQPAPGERVTHIYKTLTERVPVKQEGGDHG